MDRKCCKTCRHSMTNKKNGALCEFVRMCKLHSHWQACTAPTRLERKDVKDDGTIRNFDTGATRDTSVDKLDFEAFLSPIVLKRYAQYLDANRLQSDGTLRDGDNWQKGIPKDVYMKSLTRHFMDTWLVHRGFLDDADCRNLEINLCAVLFNAMGMLYEILNERDPDDAVQEN